MKIELTKADIDLIKALLRGHIMHEYEKSISYEKAGNRELMIVACNKCNEAEEVLSLNPIRGLRSSLLRMTLRLISERCTVGVPSIHLHLTLRTTFTLMLLLTFLVLTGRIFLI